MCEKVIYEHRDGLAHKRPAKMLEIIGHVTGEIRAEFVSQVKELGPQSSTPA